MKDRAKLTAILTYHVVSGKMKAVDVVKQKSLKTVQGKELSIDSTEGVKVGTANVVKTDIDAINGVIRVIDTVLIP